MSEITVSDARANLPELLDRIADGEEVTITRHGRPAAVMLRPDALRLRRGTVAKTVDDLRRVLDQTADTPLEGRGISAEHADQILRDVRASRTAR